MKFLYNQISFYNSGCEKEIFLSYRNSLSYTIKKLRKDMHLYEMNMPRKQPRSARKFPEKIKNEHVFDKKIG